MRGLNHGRVWTALAILAVALFMATLARLGPLPHGGGRSRIVSHIVTTAVERFGSNGAAFLFAGVGIVLAAMSGRVLR